MINAASELGYDCVGLLYAIAQPSGTVVRACPNPSPEALGLACARL